MKNKIFNVLLFTLLLISLLACTEKENDIQKQLELKSIGFVGTMPDGRTLNDQGLLATTEQTQSSSTTEGSHIAHILSVTDSVAGVTLRIELPRIKYSDNFIRGDEPGSLTTKQVAQEFYPYQKVKEKLSVGDKFILSAQTPDITKSFRVLWVDNIHYKGYTSESSYDQAKSYLKVKELIENTETDPLLGQVKSMEVIFDIDVQLYSYTEPATKQPEKLKGLLRMKYTQI